MTMNTLNRLNVKTKCAAIKRNGRPCKQLDLIDGYCKYHQPKPLQPKPQPPKSPKKSPKSPKKSPIRVIEDDIDDIANLTDIALSLRARLEALKAKMISPLPEPSDEMMALMEKELML